MRRVWSVVAVVAVAATFGMGGVAAAQSGGTRASVSCSSLAKKYEHGSVGSSSVDISNPKSLNQVFHEAGKAFQSLASTGPSSLRPAFLRLSRFYSHLSSADLSNPSTLSQLEQFGTTYRADLEKIAQYFAKKCGITIPTTPTS